VGFFKKTWVGFFSLFFLQQPCVDGSHFLLQVKSAVRWDTSEISVFLLFLLGFAYNFFPFNNFRFSWSL